MYAATYAPNHLTLEKPYQKGGNWVMPAIIDLRSGDSIRIEATITPQTIERAKAHGMAAAERLRKWVMSNVTLPPEWSAWGNMGKAAAGVAYKTATHPALSLPLLSEDKKDKSHPAFAVAHQMLAADGYGSFERLRDHCSAPNARQDLRELMAAACQLGNCCCGMKVVRSCYDLGYLYDHPWAAPHHDIACHATDQQALRSYRAIWGAD